MESSDIKSVTSTPSPRYTKKTVKSSVTDFLDSLDDSDDDDIQVLGKEKGNQLFIQVQKASTILMNVSKSNVS
jgi:hypothetical protein